MNLRVCRLFAVAGFTLAGVLGSAQSLAQIAYVTNATSQFDGTYGFVSGTALNETYRTTGTARMGRCRNPRYEGPLTIVNGQARYTSATGYQLEGTVGSRGELEMRSITAGNKSVIIQIETRGWVDDKGTASAQQVSIWCSFNLLWRKEK